MWKHKSDASKRKEKQKWAKEKPKLDNAKRSRGIYFVDSEDEEFKGIMKNARRKLKVPMPATMPCKIQREEYKKTCRVEKNCKKKHACIVEADESTRKRMEGCLHKNHVDQRAGKRMNSLKQYNLWDKFIPMPKALKTQDAKAAIDTERSKLEKTPAWQLTKVRNKEVIAEARNQKKKVHCASVMDLCHLKNSELE